MLRHLLNSFLALALSLAVTLAPVTAQEYNFVLPGHVFAAAAPTEPAKILFVTQSIDITDTDVFTFNDISTGTADAFRYTAFVGCGKDSATGFGLTGATVDGVSATKIFQTDFTTSLIECSLFVIANPSGTTADIVLTFSEPMTSASIGVFALYNISSATPTDTAFEFQTSSANQVLSLDIPQNGVGLGFSTSAGSGNTTIWTGMSERTVEGSSADANHQFSSAVATSNSGLTPLTVGSDWSGTTDSVGVTASWGGLTEAATPSVSFIGRTSDTTDASSHTFTDHAIGTADPTRKVGVVVCGEDTATTFGVNSVTVQGFHAFEIVDTAGVTARASCATYVVDVPEGTTGTIVVTWSEAITDATIAVFAIYDLNSFTATDSASAVNIATTALTLDLDVSANGVGVGGCASHFNSTFTWAGFTERDDVTATGMTASSADTTQASAQTPLTVNCDPSQATENAGVSVSFR